MQILNQRQEKKVYTVTELSSVIKSLFEQTIGSVWIEGELSNVKCSSSGHFYMTLKDENAQISLVVFKNVAKSLKFTLENGQKVLVSGKTTIYEKSSEYQIIALYVEPSGLGALQLAFEQLKEKLAKEGLFDISRKKSIPYLPKKIGIVTSKTGAVIQDILNITARRCPLTDIILAPVKVQGDGAAQEIARAVDLFNEMQNVDVIIVARGGGSLEDLWAFNEEVVARSIAASKIPVVSAVGHEVDFTIADFVADLRAPTPSAAAELVVPDISELRKRLLIANRDLYNDMLSKIEFLKNKLQRLSCHYVFKEPAGAIRTYIQRVDDLELQLKQNMKFYLKNISSRFILLSDTLDAFSPLKVLARGYSITTDMQGNVFKSAKNIKQGDELQVYLSDGKISVITRACG